MKLARVAYWKQRLAKLMPESQEGLKHVSNVFRTARRIPATRISRRVETILIWVWVWMFWVFTRISRRVETQRRRRKKAERSNEYARISRRVETNL